MTQTCMNSALCIFDAQPMQTDIISSKIVDYHPINNIEGSDIPIQFDVAGNTEEYIDCQDITLEVKLKILKSDGKSIGATDKVGLTNLAISSMFGDVSLMLNDKQIEGGDHSYAYASYLSTLTQFQEQAKKTHLRACGWATDEAGKFDNDGNSGLVKRMKWSEGSKEFQLQGPVNLDFFRQSRYLISQVNMRITFRRSKAEFALMTFGTEKYKISITGATLYVRKMLMNPKVINEHAVGLKSHNALYPINHCELTTFTIPTGTLSYTRDRLFPVNMPKALYVCMVDNEAYNGNFKKNPYNLQHYDLCKLALYADGDYVVYKPFTPNVDNKLYLREYCAAMQSLGMYNTDDSNGISYKEFGHGSFFFMFDLTPDTNLRGNARYPTKPGNLRLELQFKTATSDTINVLLYAVYDGKVEITELRDILTSYQR